MKKIAFLAMAAALALGSAGAALAQTVTLKFHTFMPPASAVWKDMHTVWMDRVEKASGGRIRFERYPAMQLGGTPANLIDQVRDGVVDVTWTLVGYTPGRMPRIEAFELPFMMTSAEATSKALWEYMQAHGRDELRDLHPLAFHVHGPGLFHMKDRPVRAIADLKGLKVRGPSRLATNMLKALGATPVGMPLPQIPDALGKGVIDGCMLPWEVVPAIKVQELTRFHSEFDPSLPGLYTSAFVLAMNRAKYASLPPDLKKVIDEHSGLETSAWLGKVQQANDTPGRRSAEDRKNTIVRMGPAEYEAFRQAADRVDDDWIREMAAKNIDGKALLDSARALIRKHSN